jgi:predicted CoA-binding protein
VVVIETDRGPWVKALAAAGYRVYPANPKQAARHEEWSRVVDGVS